MDGAANNTEPSDEAVSRTDLVLDEVDFHNLLAIWVFASNDDVPIITYRGLESRLQIKKEHARHIVQLFRELFRDSVPKDALDLWKNRLMDAAKQGKAGPVWLSDGNDEEKRKQIEELTVADCFRSQFRRISASSGWSDASTGIVLKSPKSRLDVLEWGAAHIERLRRAVTEERDFRKTLTTLNQSVVALKDEQERARRQRRVTMGAAILAAVASILGAVLSALLKKG